MNKNLFTISIATIACAVAPLLVSAQTFTVSASTTPTTVTGSLVTTTSRPICPSFSRSLFIGATGSDVTSLQAFLLAHAYLTVSPTGYFGLLTRAAVAQWQADGNVAAQNSGGSGIFGPLSRAFFARSCGTSTTTSIQKVNAPATVTLSLDGIAEVRNKSYYFTLQSVASSSATIQPTAVGCWNSFPSDPVPQVRCMIAVMPLAPQMLSIGQIYQNGNFNLTLISISNGQATFSIQ